MEYRFFPCTAQGRAAAVACALGHADQADVYAGMGEFACLPAHGRGKSLDVVELHALWGEVDLAGAGHRLEPGEVLPDTVTAVHALAGMAPRPSLIVFSAGGLHLYWLLSAPLLTNRPATHKHAKDLLESLWERIRRQLALEGQPFKVDKVSDLARVLRVPGTINHKIPGQPRPVQIAWPTDLTQLRRYDLSAFAGEPVPPISSPEKVNTAQAAPDAPGVGAAQEPHVARQPRAIDRLLAAARGRHLKIQKKTTRNGYLIQCPGPLHGEKGDRHPSLDVDVVEDRVLVICRVGCDTDDVLRVLGLGWADLFDTADLPETDSYSIGNEPGYEVPGDAAVLYERYRADLSPDLLEEISRRLGLSGQSLQRLGLGFRCADSIHSGGCWTWPMYAPDGRVMGFRLRDQITDRKTTERGTHSGLFLPKDLPSGGQLLITEGPTDAAAALDLGYAAIGRGSASTCVRHCGDFVRVHKPQSVVIVADRDEHKTGFVGASQLACHLVSIVTDVRVILPPVGQKDLRDWLRGGATRQVVDERIRRTKPVRIGIE